MQIATKWAIVAFLMSFVWIGHAGLIVYEPFQGYPTGQFEKTTGTAGQTPNANTIGLDQTVQYQDIDLQNYSTSYDSIMQTGLTFSDLQVSGGKCHINKVRATGTGPSIGTRLSLGAPVTSGYIWTSYLVQINARPSTLTNFGIAMGFLPTTNSNWGPGAGKEYYEAAADVLMQSSDPTNSNVGLLNKDSSTMGQNAVSGNATLSAGVTYLIVGKFKVDAATTDAKVWALTAANYDSIKAGGITEAALTSANHGFASDTTASHASGMGLTSTNFLYFQITGVSGSTCDVDLDELRVGTGADPATAGVVPENGGPTPNIVVLGKGSVTIANGAATPSSGNGTDFGSVSTSGASVTNTYVITNSGSANLYLTGVAPVSYGGQAGFTVNTAATSTNLAAGAYTTFQVVFAPSATGLATGLITIADNVAGQNPYTYSIQGTGIGIVPVIGVSGKGNAITNNDLTPSSVDGTDLGNAAASATAVTNTFVITNTGLASLTVSTPTVGDTANFAIDASGLSSPVAVSGWTSFRVVFHPVSTGLKASTVNIVNNATNFQFAMQGTGVAYVPTMAVRGNGNAIANGSAAPSTANGSDFGSVALLGIATTTFVITNSGVAPLTLTGVTPITIAGSGAFAVNTNATSTTIPASASTTFQIVFNPSVVGIMTGIVSIADNDAGNNPYTFAIQGSAGVISNTIPYAESFEFYPSGFALAGTNGWYSASPTMATVSTNNYTAAYGGGFPIAGPHQNSLLIDGAVSNVFAPSAYTNVWCDMIVQAQQWSDPTLPTADTMTNVSFAFLFTTNNYVAIWNCLAPPDPTCGWTELLDTTVTAGQYVRMTVGATYARDTTNYFHYQVWVNGTNSVNPRTSYAAADPTRNTFAQIEADGTFFLDDLAVSAFNPFASSIVILASSTGPGAIAPSGSVLVAAGSTDVFTNTPATWYQVGSLLVDGTNVGALATYTFTNVAAPHTIAVNFTPILAASNTPVWWLYQINTNWAADFNAAALSADPNHAGMPIWQEYVSGMSPTNATNVFALTISTSNGLQIVSLPTMTTTAQDGLQRYYAIESCSNLIASAWQPLPGWTNVPGLGQTLCYTNQTGGPTLFYRSRVWMGP